MTPEVKAEIERILGENRILTVATNRHDGYPQATIVGYANDGLILYFFVARQSQKAANIAHDPRVSIAVGKDNAHPLEIKALSMSASALLVEDETEMRHAGRLLMQRYPEYRTMPEPDVSQIILVRATPEFVSIIDYAKGFGHSELVKLTSRDLDDFRLAHQHHWAGEEEADRTSR
jgi:nitroimidazol reductase NimA-like FMN-containing flavoprotein (pyridoxamine 5'-phosphate oxidase superfamily)